MSKKYFFAYGTENFNNAKERILNEATNSGFFDYCNVYSPNDISDEFKNKYHEIFSQKKGGGYWIWKFYFLRKYLNKINYGDYIIYCDAGCTINKFGKTRYLEYLELLKNSNYGIISFSMEHLSEKNYTIPEIYKFFNLDINDKYINSNQYIATTLILKKCEHSIKIIDECFKLLEYDKYLITDKYSKINARHDQSILSLVRKKYGSIVLFDETYVQPQWHIGQRFDEKYPFWATRYTDDAIKKYGIIELQKIRYNQ